MAVRRGTPTLSVLWTAYVVNVLPLAKIVVVQRCLLNLEIATLAYLLAVMVVQLLLNLELTVVVQLLRNHLRIVNLAAVQVQRDVVQQQLLLLIVTLEQCTLEACPVEGV